MAKSKKVSKWEAAPESIRKLNETIRFLFDRLEVQTYNIDDPEYKELVDEVFKGLDKALDDYNELEAKHNADCGLISKLEEEVKAYETLTAELHNDVDELEYKVNNLEKMVEFHKGEVKELVKTADKVRDKHADKIERLKGDISYLEARVKFYIEDNEGFKSKLDSVTRERNHAEHILTELIEQLKIKNDVYVDINECIDGNYKVENKRAADLQCDLDAAIYDLKKEEENVECLKKQITRKNAEMCNLKWEYDETEKKFKILTEELKRQYDIKVTFYQKPGIDMHGLRNFGVNIDCEENRKAFNELKEALDKHKSQIDKLETKHAKATRFIARLTEALYEAGVTFHYVKIGADGEDIFYIDSLVDRMAKKHYEEQSFRLRNTVRNYGEQIRCFKNDISELQAEIDKLKKDRKEIEHRNLLLLKALDRAGIRSTFDSLNDKWLIQYTDKAENAFLAADQIKRDAEKKLDKLVSALSKCNLEAKWDCDDRTWHVYVMTTGQIVKNIAVDYCTVFGYVNELRDEIEKLKTELDNLKSKNRSWQVKCNNLQSVLNFRMHDGTPCGITNCPKVEELTAERDGLNDYVKALKKKLNTIYGYRDTDNPCGICKNFDPRE